MNKRKKSLLFLLAGSLGLVSLPAFSFAEADFVEAKATVTAPSGTASRSLPSSETIDLSDEDDEGIRAYYSSLDSLSETERQGTNLLKNLKSIIKNMYYYSYDNVWKIYEITDRDWSLSPASETSYGTYDATNEQITSYRYGTNSTPRNDPYVYTLYRNRDNADGHIKNWGEHSAQTGTNREHVWPQSRGFKASSGASGPAGTDVHHLKSGDARVNQNAHNNNPYGNVDLSKSHVDESNYRAYLAGNYSGVSIYDGASTVFEPQDSDKGDIARACFYMAARYNNWAGTSGAISEFEPFLEITDEAYDEAAAVGSSDTASATMGILHDLLEWHEEDPVDEYEIHRNNLIYHNYQANRNPFIDFPEWVTYIWGTSDDMTAQGSASPSSDTINGYNNPSAPKLDKTSLSLAVGESSALNATSASDVTWSLSSEGIVSLAANGKSATITALSVGEVTVSATSDLGTASCLVSVHAAGGSSAPSSSDPQPEPTPEEQKDQPNIMLIAIIGAGLVILVILAILGIKIPKKKRKKRKKKK